MANLVANSAIDMTSIGIGGFASGTVTTHTVSVYRVTYGSDFDELSGSGFTYNGADRITGGLITGWTRNVGGSTAFTVTGLANYDASTFAAFVTANNPSGLLASMFSGNDSLSGSTQNDFLLGYDGIDTVLGGLGNDTIDGGLGADKLAGHGGDDVYIVDDAGDVVTDAAGQGWDTVRSSVSYILGVNTEAVELTGSADVNATGNATNNSLTGNSGKNDLQGGNGNDTLSGGGGADTLAGGAGNDTYITDGLDTMTEAAGAGFDVVESSASHVLGDNFENLTLTGSAANGTGNILANVIVGNSSSNVLAGLGGNDSLYGGGGGTDALDGGDGNDTLDGWGSTSTLTGGAGNDLYYVDGGDTVVEAFNEGTDTVESTNSHTLAANVENLIMTGWGSNGTGNAENNSITGNDNNNKLTGAAGNDTMDGGNGNDTLRGDDGVDSLIGGTGNDDIDGGLGADKMGGGLDDDTYTVDDAGDLVAEGLNQGIDTVRTALAYTLGANLENLILTGAAAVDGVGNTLHNAMTGNTAINELNGGAGDDTLNGGGGADTLIGGAGNDLLVYDGDDTIVEVLVGGGIDTVQSSVTFTLTNVLENLTLTGGSSIDGTGNTLNNVIVGNSGSNLLNGDAGNDSMVGGGGTDKLDGGVGNDTLDGVGSLATLIGGVGNDLFIVDGNDTIVEFAGEGVDTVASHVNHTLAAEFENLMLLGGAVTGAGNDVANDITGNDNGNNLSGGLGNDTIDGGEGNDALSGEDGVDYLIGGGGNDLLTGGAGIDKMAGGLGDDTYVLDVVTDVVIEGAGQGWDTVQAAFALNLAANVEALQLIGSTNINANGNTGHNWIAGNNGNNLINGGAGNDTLMGGAGTDTLVGGAGNDYFYWDGTDKITEAAGGGLDTIETSVDIGSTGIPVNVENVILTGSAFRVIGNNSLNVITGTNNDNSLDGGMGNDTLYGNGGNDTLIGGFGNDKMYGGEGADRVDCLYNNDRVMYTSTLDAGDLLTNFSTGGTTQDYIDLDGLFDSLGVATAQRASRVSVVDNGGGVDLMIDTDGVGGADLHLLTIQYAPDPLTVSVGNLATNDVFVGTL